MVTDHLKDINNIEKKRTVVKWAKWDRLMFIFRFTFSPLAGGTSYFQALDSVRRIFQRGEYFIAISDGWKIWDKWQSEEEGGGGDRPEKPPPSRSLCHSSKIFQPSNTSTEYSPRWNSRFKTQTTACNQANSDSTLSCVCLVGDRQTISRRGENSISGTRARAVGEYHWY